MGGRQERVVSLLRESIGSSGRVEVPSSYDPLQAVHLV